MQEVQADNVGLGQYVRNSLSYQEWTDLNWREAYKNAEIDVNVEVKLKEFGNIH